MIEEPADAHGKSEAPVGVSGPSRARRLFAGWSANFVQMILGMTQQVALVPVFLHFWTSEVLAAWLAIYAVGNLVMIADGGLQFRAINRFLAFKSSVDCDGRTARFYVALLRIYQVLGGVLVVLALVGSQLVSPATVLGFRAVANFDTAFAVMTVGLLLYLPTGLVSGLYRARGLYGRAVRLQNWSMLISQVGQLVAVIMTGNLLAVTFAYAATQVLTMAYVLAIDAPRLFPFLRGASVRHSWRWIVGQFRLAFPFAVATTTEIVLQYLPVLLVSAFVSDRVAVAQWGLTRIAAGMLRMLSVQTTLPLAAELGHDYAIGSKEQLRNLYARGSVFVTLLASVVVSGLLPFWPDFFVLWTNGVIPYDPLLTVTLLIGTSMIAPSILAFGYASYSNRGALLVRTKGLQFAVFVMLSLVLIPPMGPLGAAIAIVASDLLVQFAVLAIIMRQTLQHPLRHVAFLLQIMVAVTLCGWGLGTAIRSLLHGIGPVHFAAECTLWLVAVALIASPLLNTRLRNRLVARIPT